MWSERNARGIPGDPPCETCRVDLAEENKEAVEIYYMTRGQIVTLGENIVDINHMALWQNIDRFKVKNPERCFALVNKAFHHFLKKEREERG